MCRCYCSSILAFIVLGSHLCIAIIHPCSTITMRSIGCSSWCRWGGILRRRIVRGILYWRALSLIRRLVVSWSTCGTTSRASSRRPTRSGVVATWFSRLIILPRRLPWRSRVSFLVVRSRYSSTGAIGVRCVILWRVLLTWAFVVIVGRTHLRRWLTRPVSCGGGIRRCSRSSTRRHAISWIGALCGCWCRGVIVIWSPTEEFSHVLTKLQSNDFFANGMRWKSDGY